MSLSYCGHFDSTTRPAAQHKQNVNVPPKSKIKFKSGDVINRPMLCPAHSFLRAARKRIEPLSQVSGIPLAPVGLNQKTPKLVFTASLLDIQQLMGQCEASTACGRQVGRWQPD